MRFVRCCVSSRQLCQFFVSRFSFFQFGQFGHIGQLFRCVHFVNFVQLVQLGQFCFPFAQFLLVFLVLLMRNPSPQDYVEKIRAACKAQLDAEGVSLVEMTVPGALDLVSGAKAAMRLHKPACVIALGVLIKGDSDVGCVCTQLVSPLVG